MCAMSRRGHPAAAAGCHRGRVEGGEAEEAARQALDEWRHSNQVGLGCWLVVVVGGGWLIVLVAFVMVAGNPR